MSLRVLAAARIDREVLTARQPRDLVTVQSGGIDHDPRADRLGWRAHLDRVTAIVHRNQRRSGQNRDLTLTTQVRERSDEGLRFKHAGIR